MKRKILCLDDNDARLEQMERLFVDHDIVCVTDVPSCIYQLDRARDIDVAWDVVFLDHDLGGQTYVNSDRPDTGMEVVRWLQENTRYIWYFIVHSYNSPAGKRMLEGLKGMGRGEAYIPFGSPHFLHKVRLIKECPTLDLDLDL